MSGLNYSGPTVKSECINHLDVKQPQKSTSAFQCEFCAQEFHLKDHLIRHAVNSHQLPIRVVKSEEHPTSSNKPWVSTQSISSQQRIDGEIGTLTPRNLKHQQLAHNVERHFQC
eukprot:799530_1